MADGRPGEPTYAGAGVDVAEGQRTVSAIRASVESTRDGHVLSALGGFGALYALEGYRNPVLVSGADGVGTKVELARLAGRLEGIGIDCVAMCVNDILCHLARPLFFLDYIAVDKLRAENVAQIVSGVAEGCRRAGCSLVGGETAEMPGVYQPDRFDLAGFCVGVVEREKLIVPERIERGMRVLGLGSSGLHSNGFSLVRRILGAEDRVDHLQDGSSDGPANALTMLLEPTRIYVASVLALAARVPVYGAAHITGGGWYENLPRMLPPGLTLALSRDALPLPPVYRLLSDAGIGRDEMYRTFNMGLGMAIVVREEDSAQALRVLSDAGEVCAEIGTVIEDAGASNGASDGDGGIRFD